MTKVAKASRVSAAAASKKKAAASISLGGMSAVIDDARRAGLSTDSGPPEPNQFDQLVSRLKAVQGKFPPVYEQGFVTPFIETVSALGAAKFAQVLASDPHREGAAGLMLDLAQAILQHGEGYQKKPTRAFQELIADLYDGFLSAEDRRGINPPDRGVIPPLAKWGNPDSGPYTWPIDAAASFHVDAGVVNLPPANQAGGLVAWAALGHETAGHDILHADTGLQDQLASALKSSLAPLGHGLADYWAERIDETSSDVMGLLNLGPAAGIGLIAYFRGLGAAAGFPPVLRSEGPADDPHPADLLRGYLAAEVISLLKFAGRSAWSKVIADETDQDRAAIVLAGVTVTPAVARKSAKLVAETLVGSPAAALEDHALGDIQNWADTDEAIVDSVRTSFRTGAALPPPPPDQKIYAAHLVAAAVIEALATGTNIAGLQSRLVTELNTLHDQNPSWGPLFVAHAGNLRRDFYVPAAWRRRS